MAANRKVLGAVLRYRQEQGVTGRLFTAEAIFVPEFLTTRDGRPDADGSGRGERDAGLHRVARPSQGV